jgi:prepilin-type N-terminal cleavage/methylation domain-containing protein
MKIVREMRNRRNRGFSLIELLIVVAIILIIAGIAIPSLNRAKMSANETSAIYSLKAVVEAAVQYNSTYGNGYPPSLGSLGGANGAPTATCDGALLIDSVLSNNGIGNTSLKAGYTITYVPGIAVTNPPAGCTNPGVNSYTLYAVPAQIGSTGQRGFFTDPSGVIRFSTDGTVPTTTSPALQ